MFAHKIAKNASWIIGCRIAQAVIGLVVGMLTARYLGPSNFGVINYAASMVAFVTPLMQLGLNDVMVQELVDHPEKDGEILGTSILMSSLSALLCGAALFVTVSFLNAGETETIVVCCLYSTILIFQAAELTQYWFQAKYLSKYTSLAAFFAYMAVATYRIVLLVTGQSVYWFAVSNSFAAVLIAGSYFVLYKKKGGGSFKLSLKTAKRLLAKSHFYILASMMVVIFAQTDRIMIKNMLGNAETGYYSAAITCAGMTTFVFAALIDSFRPLIFEKKKVGGEGYENSVVSLYSVIIYLAMAQSVVMTVFAPFIIKILYGAAYAPSVTALQIVVWYTTFSYLGSARSIWILAESKQKYLWFIHLLGVFANVGLNFALIPLYGINGAAVASVITQFFINIGTGWIVRPIRYNNVLIFRALNPKYLKQIVSRMRNG